MACNDSNAFVSVQHQSLSVCMRRKPKEKSKMKVVLSGIYFAILFHISDSDNYIRADKGVNAEIEFQKYMIKFNKHYKLGTSLYEKRLSNFQGNLRRAQVLNAHRTHNASAWYGITKFSDLSPREFKETFLSDVQSLTLNATIPQGPTDGQESQVANIPKKIDWREKSVISPVKNQHSCGGCWAFSAAEVAESMYATLTGDLRKLSVQQILDCSYGYKGIIFSCRGGDTCSVLDWLKNVAGPVVDEPAYPTSDSFQPCKLMRNGTKGVKIKDYTCANFKRNEDSVLELLAHHGPVVVTVDATSWHNYQGGIIQYHCETRRNHAVVLVGYDLTGTPPYYIVRNSWGPDWGHAGYLYLKVGANVCGVAEEVSSLNVLPDRVS